MAKKLSTEGDMRLFRLEALCNIVTYFIAAIILIGTADAQNATDKCSGLPDLLP